MKRTYWSVLMLVLMLSAWLSAVNSAQAASPSPITPQPPQLTLTFDPSGNAAASAGTPGSTGVSQNKPSPSTNPGNVVYEDAPACVSTYKGPAICASDQRCIAPAELYIVLSMTPPATDFVDTGERVCLGGPDGPVPPIAGNDALVAAAGQEVTKDFPFDPPTPATNPAPTTLVNLPTILTAGADQHTLNQDATLLGVNVTLTATPAFHWVLPGLPDIKTSDPGTPYDGTDPTKDPDHYVTATWTTTGTRQTSLSVTWTVTLVRHDTGETLTATDPVDKTSTVTVDVKQARSELTGNS